MTRRDKVALSFFVPSIACFVVAHVPQIDNGPLNVALILAGIGLFVLGFLRMRKTPEP